MIVTGYTLGQSWGLIHTELVDPVPLHVAMAAISDEISALESQGRIYTTITLNIEED